MQILKSKIARLTLTAVFAVPMLQVTLSATSSASPAGVSFASADTYTVTGKIPKTWHVRVVEIGPCQTCPSVSPMSKAVGHTDVAKDGAFTMTDVPSGNDGVLTRFFNGYSKRPVYGSLKPKKDGVFVVDATGTLHPAVVSILGDSDLGVIVTKSSEKNYPQAQVSLRGYGKLGGVLTLFFDATHLRPATVVSLSYSGCGHLLAHRRYTGLRGSKVLRLTHSLRHVPKTGTVSIVVSEPKHDVWRVRRPAGPIPHVHC